jgi:hypothetical protein
VSIPKFEVASGVIDGLNKTFTVSVAYSSNTTAVFLNGVLYRRDWDNGWVETNPAMGIVDLIEAPILGDVVQIFFTDATGPQLEEECTPLHGHLVEVGYLRGRLLDAELRLGSVVDLGLLDGRLLDPHLVLGVLDDPEVLRAQLHEVCD